MNKGDLVEKVADAAGISKKAAHVAVETVFGEITKAMKKGDRVQVTGFGSFESTKRPGRKGLNPATGESLYIKTKFVPKFHPGKGLKDEVAKRRK
ncbi:DNA-binding protein HU [bacterium BMS3Abin02]|nr:DNA-binding protein HU [bacterium BMS3Abin02]HDL49564.1 HU family DNA-binding protein [Actinomycetota bacterium]